MADIQTPYDRAIALVNVQLSVVEEMQEYCRECVAVLLKGKEPDDDLPVGFHSYDTLKFTMDRIHDVAELVRKFANSDDPSTAGAEAALRDFKGLTSDQRKKVIHLIESFSPVSVVTQPTEKAVVAKKPKRKKK